MIKTHHTPNFNKCIPLQAVLNKHSKHNITEEEVTIYTPIIIDRILTPWGIKLPHIRTNNLPFQD